MVKSIIHFSFNLVECKEKFFNWSFIKPFDEVLLRFWWVIQIIGECIHFISPFICFVCNHLWYIFWFLCYCIQHSLTALLSYSLLIYQILCDFYKGGWIRLDSKIHATFAFIGSSSSFNYLILSALSLSMRKSKRSIASLVFPKFSSI